MAMEEKKEKLLELDEVRQRIAKLEKLSGEMSDYIPTDEDLAKGFATIPNVNL